MCTRICKYMYVYTYIYMYGYVTVTTYECSQVIVDDNG